MQTILLSALFAGIVAVLVTVAIEKWGGIVGGILGTLPTTIVPAAIGMYLEAGSEDLAISMSLIPFRMLLKFIPILAGFGVDGSNTEESLIPEDMSKVEVSPITWE